MCDWQLVSPDECTVVSCKASWIWHPGCSLAGSCQRSICYQAPLPPGYCSGCWFWKISNSTRLLWEEHHVWGIQVPWNNWHFYCRLMGKWLTLWRDFRFPSTLRPPVCRAWKLSYSRLHQTCPRSHPPHCTAEFWEYSDLKERTDVDGN